mmetsp:Transcript_18384/g.31424  ORF Transcript_18384/g.31424 Transcript_18384/m.31424 type:complete len:169 (+) Transcript_18384:47-553(+)
MDQVDALESEREKTQHLLDSHVNIPLKEFDANANFLSCDRLNESTACTEFFEKLIDSKDVCQLQQILSGDENEFPITSSCPKTKLNILQYFVLQSKFKFDSQAVMQYLEDHISPTESIKLIFESQTLAEVEGSRFAQEQPLETLVPDSATGTLPTQQTSRARKAEGPK